MLRTCTALALTVALTGTAWAEPPKQPPAKADSPPAADDAQQTPVFRLTVRPETGSRPRALKHPLLPDYLERVPGNAAPLWVRAGAEALLTQPQLIPQEEEEAGRPLKDMPRQDIRRLLNRYQRALHLADQAALRDRCDWERPPLTIRTLEDLPLTEIQSFRLLASLLHIRARLEMAEGRPDQALRTLQVGMALARDVGNGPTLIDSLVGIAIAEVMLYQTWVLLERPDAPNLYWGATMLPTPFLDLQRTMQSEAALPDRSYPELRGLEKGKLSGAAARAVVEDLFRHLAQSWTVQSVVAREGIPDLAALTKKDYAEAKRYLLAHGHKEEQVNGMLAEEAVALYLLGRYGEDRDDVLKWFAAPPWEGMRGIEGVEKRSAEHPERSVLSRLLLAAVPKVNFARARLERDLAALRSAEAIRLYAAGHDGHPPQHLSDVTEVPLPIDPYTGKGFEDYYKGGADRAVLDVPPPPNMPPSLGRRFEFTRAQ